MQTRPRGGKAGLRGTLNSGTYGAICRTIRVLAADVDRHQLRHGPRCQTASCERLGASSSAMRTCSVGTWLWTEHEQHGDIAWHLVTGNQAPAIDRLSVLKIILKCGSSIVHLATASPYLTIMMRRCGRGEHGGHVGSRWSR